MPFGDIAKLLGTPDQGTKVVSAYVRASADGGASWNYTLLPFGAATDTPVPIYFKPPGQNATAKGAKNTASAQLSTAQKGGETWLVVKLTVTLDPPTVDALAEPRVEVVISPERTILPGGPPAPRLSVIVLSLGRTATGQPVKPRSMTVTASVPLAADGQEAPVEVRVQNHKNIPVVAWLADGPTVQRTAHLGSTVGLEDLDQDLQQTLEGLLEGVIDLSPGGNNYKLYAVDQVLTVDTDEAVTGMRAAMTFPPGAGADVPVRLEVPWSPAARPAVAVGPHSGAGELWRYSVAAIASDPDKVPESPPGAASPAFMAAPQEKVQVTVPEAPDHAHFAHWRLYRSRLAPSGWTVPEFVANVFGGKTVPDTLPRPGIDKPTAPADPGRLTGAWGKGGLAAPKPAGMPLDVRLEQHDEAVPGKRLQVVKLQAAKLPASGTGTLRGARGAEPLVLQWDAAATQAMVDISSELSLASLLVMAGVPEAATFALASAGVRAALSAPLAGETAFGEVVAAWSAKHSTGVKARVVTAPEGGQPTTLALSLTEVPGKVAMRLALPRKPAVHEPELLGNEPWAPVALTIADWPAAPPPGQPPAPAPDDQPAKTLLPGNAPTGGIGRALVTYGPAGTATFPVPGPGPGLAVDLLLPPDGETAVAAVDVKGLRRFALERKAGHVVRFVTRLDLLTATAGRIRLATRRPAGDVTSIHARVGTVAPVAELAIGLLTVEPALLADRLDPQETPGELRVEVPPVGNDTSAVLTDVRVFVDAGGGGTEPSALVLEADALRRGAKVTLLPVPVAVAGAGGDLYAWSSRPEPAQSLGARIAASLPTGGKLRLVSQAGAPPAAKGEPDTRRSPIDVVTTVPVTARLRFGGDVGTLAAGSGAGKIVDPDAAFTGDWTGRSVFWRGGNGRVTGSSGGDLAIEVLGGTPPDPSLPPLLAWYRVGERDRSEGGASLRADGPLRGRIGLVADERPEHRLRLRAPVAGPRARLEQLDDLEVPKIAADRGKLAAVGARFAATGFALSTWKIADEEVRQRLPLTRLLGSLQMPHRFDVVEETPEEHTWASVSVALDPARANRSFGLIAHSRRISIDRGRDTASMRLVDTPDSLGMLSGPSVMELVADKPFGPGELVAEPAVWLRDAPFAEAAYGRAQLVEVPKRLLIATGWRTPELVNEFGPADFLKTIHFGPIGGLLWRRDVTRIVVDGPLKLGRMSTVRWDTAAEVDEGDVASETFPALWETGRKIEYALSDVWCLELTPSGPTAEALLHTTFKAFAGGDSNVQMTANDGKLKARVFKVKLGQRPMAAGRRARMEVAGWASEIAAEIQMCPIDGSFAVGKQVGLDSDPFRYLQDDETSGDSWWWLGSYVLFGSAQFGSHGFTGMYDAPWDPYWA